MVNKLFRKMLCMVVSVVLAVSMLQCTTLAAELTNETITWQNNKWLRSGADDDEMTVKITENSVLEVDKIKPSDVSAGVNLLLDTKQEQADIKINYSVSYESFEAQSKNAKTIYWHIMGFDATGDSKKIAQLEFRFSQTSFIIAATKENPEELYRFKTVQSDLGDDINVQLDINLQNGTYNLMLGGESITSEPIIFQTKDTENPVVKLNSVNIRAFGDSYGVKVRFKEVAISYPLPKIVFDSPIFKKVSDENDEVLVDAPVQGKIRTEIKARNLTDENKKSAFITAIYDAQKKLKSVKIDEKTLDAGKNNTFATMHDIEAGDIYRCFFLDSLSSLKPISISAAKPKNLTAEFGYDDEEKACISLNWDDAYAPQENLKGYKILRNQVEIGFVPAGTTEYNDYNCDFFSDKAYEVRTVTTSDISPDGIYADVEAQKSVKLLPTAVTDEVTGRKYQYIDFFGRNAIRDYYTTRNWANDEKCHRFYFTDDNKRIFEYDIDTKMVTFIDNRFQYDIMTPEDLMYVGKATNSLYYVDSDMDVARVNLYTYTKEKIADLPENVWYCRFMTVSDDEKKLTLYWNENGADAKVGRIPVLDIESGEWDTTFSCDLSIDAPWTATNMPMINPVNTNLVMFVRTSNSYTAAPRLWLLDKDDNSCGPLYKERIAIKSDDPTQIKYGEILGHEMWTMDGEKVIVVKGSSSDYRIAPGGMCEVDLNGNIRYLNATVAGTHVSTSPTSAEWIVFDGKGTDETGVNDHVSLMNTVTGQSYKICEVLCNRPHPGHVHPSFSYDGNYVWFGFEADNEEKTIRIGWADVSDIVSQPVVGGRYPLTENSEYTSYKDTMNYVEKKTAASKESYVIPETKYMYINIDDEKYYGGITPDDDSKKYEVTINFKYYDSGDGSFSVYMYHWDETLNDYYDKTKLKSFYFKRGHTKEWKTENITLSNVNLENINVLANDISFRATTGELVISDIEITVKEQS